MAHGPEVPRVYSSDLAISRKNSILYMTGHNTHDLFSINLEIIRTGRAFQTVPSRVRLKLTYLLSSLKDINFLLTAVLRENDYAQFLSKCFHNLA